ncbi:MAG: ABC transporter permease subunit [Clostridium sp.]|uniref:ABC transporter permease subunit n=1 Tax=Clostridium sp. TaxID=1506 RepID=UPI00303B3F91
MVSLTIIEIRKLLRKRKYWISVVLLIIIMVLSVIIYISAYNSYTSYKGQIKRAEQYINQLGEESNSKVEKTNDQGINAAYKRIIDGERERIAHIKVLSDESIPWKERAEKDIEYLEGEIKKYNFSESIAENNRVKIEIIKDCIKNDIPLYGEEDGLSGIDFIKGVNHSLGILGLMIIIGLMVMDVIAGERKPATIKCLLTKPVSRWKIILAKFLACFIVANLTVLIAEVLGTIVVTAMYGVGNVDKLIGIGTTYRSLPYYQMQEFKTVVMEVVGSTYLVSNLAFIAKLLVIQTLVITAIISFVFLVTTVIHGHVEALLIIMITMIANFVLLIARTDGNKLVPANMIDKILPFLFGTYIDAGPIVNGIINKELGLTFINYKFGVLVLLTWSIVCYGLSHFIFVKSDIKA